MNFSTTLRTTTVGGGGGGGNSFSLLNEDTTDLNILTTTLGGLFEDDPSGNNSINHDSGEHTEKRDIIGFYIGVGLSILSSVFIGASFIVKKKALLKLSSGGKRANQGGYGYLRDLLWWTGFWSMAIGELANFIAYAFAPATMVSTLGILSVLVTTILSSKFLKERLNFLGKLGCFLCSIGSTVIVLHAPMEKDIASMDDLLDKLSNPMFIIYVLLDVCFCLVLIYHFRPKYSENSTKTLLIWITVCSLIGSLSVMSCKGLGLALTSTIGGQKNELGNWLTWFCLLTLIICVVVQMNFLNKSLDTFNTAVVTPIYYVFFTTCVIMASAILFREFAYLQLQDWLGLFCGFSVVLCAIFLLHFCKHYDITLHKLTQQIKIGKDDESDENCERSESPDSEFQLVNTFGDKESITYGTQPSQIDA